MNEIRYLLHQFSFHLLYGPSCISCLTVNGIVWLIRFSSPNRPARSLRYHQLRRRGHEGTMVAPTFHQHDARTSLQGPIMSQAHYGIRFPSHWTITRALSGKLEKA